MQCLGDAALLGVQGPVLGCHAVQRSRELFGPLAPAQEPIGQQRRGQREQGPDTGDDPRQGAEEAAAERPFGGHHEREHADPEGNRRRGLATAYRQPPHVGDEQVAVTPRAAQVEGVVEVGEGAVSLMLDLLLAGSGFSAYTASARLCPGALNSNPRVGCAEPRMPVRSRAPARRARQRTDARGPAERESGMAPTTTLGVGWGPPSDHSDADANCRPRPRKEPWSYGTSAARPSRRELGSRRQRRLQRRNRGRKHEAELAHAQVKQPALVSVVHVQRRERERRRDHQARRESEHAGARRLPRPPPACGRARRLLRGWECGGLSLAGLAHRALTLRLRIPVMALTALPLDPARPRAGKKLCSRLLRVSFLPPDDGTLEHRGARPGGLLLCARVPRRASISRRAERARELLGCARLLAASRVATASCVPGAASPGARPATDTA